MFIPEDKTGGALHGDKVQIVVEREPSGKRAEGAVIRILEHANPTIIGYYQKNKNFGFVIPDNQKISLDIFIPQGKHMGAVTGHKVVAAITRFLADSEESRKGKSLRLSAMSMTLEPIFYPLSALTDCRRNFRTRLWKKFPIFRMK